MAKVRKAVIPAAGMGTRFLPATKTVPKEMLPIVDAPILLHIVEEIIDAGIEDIIFVAGRGKSAIEDFFDVSYELEATLLKTGKTGYLDRLIRVRDRANFISIRQKHALGLGHAVLTAAPVVGNEPFAVLLGDEIMVKKPGHSNVTAQLIEGFSQSGASTVAIMEVPQKDVVKYGIIDPETEIRKGFFKVKNVVEKPSVESAPSRWALPGRYVFQSEIFEFLRTTKPGKNGEIQLTDGMTSLAKLGHLFATSFVARRYDAGDKLGFLQANIELGLENEEFGADLKSYLKTLVSEWR